MTFNVTLRYAGGVERTVPVLAGQTVLEAAEAGGVPIVNECQSGLCGTCVGQCLSGDYVLGRCEGLSEQEVERRRVLTCQTRLNSDCTVELDYPIGANAARLVAGEGVVTGVDLVSDTTAILHIDASALPETLNYKPGQFVQMMVPGTQQWRSYSYAHRPNNDNRLSFIVRLLPDGLMSNYLRTRAAAGDRIALRGSKGSFHLRPVSRPIVLMAGGTGLSAILAMAEQLVAEGCTQPLRLYYGVGRCEDLCMLHRLAELSRKNPLFEFQTIVLDPAPAWIGAKGRITDLLDEAAMNGGDVDLYVCGPTPMVDAIRQWLSQHNFGNAGLYYEKFVPSGAAPAGKALRIDPSVLDLQSITEQGRGTAVVIGGSIAGIATSKVLASKYVRVLVLEKDSGHDRNEGRPGAAQGWHLHHLLIAGQRVLERIFPGIIGDMVHAGAFKVDTSHQYRIFLAGSWKKVFKSGLEIVCAGRPLLEWCIRRRLDAEPGIDYRYECPVEDLVYDRPARRIVGVVVRRDGKPEVIPAEFVVDASGKNTDVPAILERIGVGAPAVEQDSLNCFYSTMRHKVPVQRRWTDKVMVVCYAYRPNQEHYAAQYYTDASRSVLSTSLVAYNCYTPPRNDHEFREFAKLMPTAVIGQSLEGLEPCSPVYNFRYPNMLRHRYEDCASLPAGLIAIGDAYCSADPVSGAGMTKALLELEQFSQLLRDGCANDAGLVKAYYRRASRIADRVWFVVREQTLRYPWVKDIVRKRPFYFSGLTWYIDRVTELIHDDMDVYRTWLSVTHFVSPPWALMAPRVAAKVLLRWFRTKLMLRKTLIERNFANGQDGERDAAMP